MGRTPKAYELRLPAIEVRQGRKQHLYMFAIDGKRLPAFTTVSRVKRSGRELDGYQRPEVLAHVSAIKSYVESDNPLIPNAIVVAFDERVRFEPESESQERGWVTRPGHLIVPVDESLPDEEKPGWIVDGQQRCAAVREADVRAFPMCVTAFIAASESEQRAQFILVNSTKPLPKGLIYELLPSTGGPLPPGLLRKQFPSLLLERLNYDEDSPFLQLIQTPTTPRGVVKDNSILRMIENSLTDGCLYYLREPETGGGDIEGMLGHLKDYWNAVKTVFSEAWGLPPRHSRLMHGVGIASMGFVMDAITDTQIARGKWPEQHEYASELAPLRDQCSWTTGSWCLGPSSTRRWNELQNTPADIRLLTNHLLSAYQKTIRDGPMGAS